MHLAASVVVLAAASACANTCPTTASNQCGHPAPSTAIIPTTATIAVGRTTQLSVSVTPAGSPVTWSSDAPGIATVSASGFVTAVSQGSATVIAAANGVAASAVVTVTAPAVGSVTVDPPAMTLAPGQSRAVAASIIGADGTPLSGIAMTWMSNNPAVATVSSAGVITGVMSGNAIVLVTAQGYQAAVAVTVQAPSPATVTLLPSSVAVLAGHSQQVTATVRDGAGNVLLGQTVLWYTSDPSIATVSSSGMVTGVAAGATLVRAMVGNQIATAAVTVTNPAVATVELSATNVLLTVGASQQLVATPKDAAGNPLLGRMVVWTSMSPGVATVSGSGLVSAVTPGTGSVVATIEGRTAVATVTVVNVPVAGVSLSTSAIALTVGATEQLIATPRMPLATRSRTVR